LSLQSAHIYVPRGVCAVVSPNSRIKNLKPKLLTQKPVKILSILPHFYFVYQFRANYLRESLDIMFVSGLPNFKMLGHLTTRAKGGEF
jgi:hypothetical protein